MVLSWPYFPGVFGRDSCAMQIGLESECLMTFLLTGDYWKQELRTVCSGSLVNVSINRFVHTSVIGSVVAETTV